MELQPSQVDIKLAEFHNSWSLDRVQNMTLEEYADLSNHDSLCYWLEYGTKQLGLIGDNPLNKFEIWKPKDPKKELKGDRYKFQDGYFWNTKKGNTRDEAFGNIRELIIQIVQNAQNLDWEAIDNVRYHSIPKWKLAFMFSSKKTLPIYSKRALLAIVNGLDNIIYPQNTKVSILQKSILKFKSDEETIEKFSHKVYMQFAKKKKPNFYIIGSKYGDGNGNDVIPKIGEFIKNQCVAIGYLNHLDFSTLMHTNDPKVNDFVFKNYSKRKPSISKIKTIFRKFSKIKEGDIIAVKSHGAYNKLTIIAYAQVVARNGNIYEHRPELLGHHINVEFLDAGFSKLIGLNYAETLHGLNSNDVKLLEKIFGLYSGLEIENVCLDEFYDENEEFEAGFIEETGFSYNNKSEESFNRNAISAVKVNQVHNIIQNHFIRFLDEKYPNTVKGERNRIDAYRETLDEVHIYEIKPYENVFSCIRDGIGQLLDYSHNYKSKKAIRIYIVGPNKPNEKDLKFINAIRTNLKIQFSYIAFDYANHNLIEY